MAMRDGSMTAAEANKLMRALEAPKQVAPPSKDESGTFGSWVLDFDKEPEVERMVRYQEPPVFSYVELG